MNTTVYTNTPKNSTENGFKGESPEQRPDTQVLAQQSTDT